MRALVEFADALRSLVRRLFSSGPRKRSVIVLALALVLIPLWQIRLMAPEVEHSRTYATFASSGVHGEPKFFFFLKHLGLYPLLTVAPILSDTKSEAERQLRENGPALRVDENVTFRSGDRGRVYLYYVDSWLNHRALNVSLIPANALGFCVALMALFAAFWWIRRPWFGAACVLMLGSDPFQLFSAYRHENVFCWAITVALFLMALHLPLFVSNPPKTKWIWALPLVSALVLASVRTVRSEGSLIAGSVILIYLTLAGARWIRRVGLAVVFVVTLSATTTAYSRFFLSKFDKAQTAMVAAGGTPYTGPLVIYHEFWHAVFCGLGDFDTKYGYKWDDRVAYGYAYPILTGKYGLKLPQWRPDWYTFQATYDTAGHYPIFFSETPHYHDIIREKVVGDIKKDPRWFLGILAKRVERILKDTPPISIHIGKEPLHTKSAIIGLLCVPLAAFLALARRWTLLKILIFTTPLSGPALLVYSDRGMTNYSTYHYFGAAILCALAVEGARTWLARRPVEDV